MGKRKILFVNDTMYMGGVEISLLRMSESLDYTKYDADLLLFDSRALDLLPRLDKRVNVITPDKRKKDYKCGFVYKCFHFVATRMWDKKSGIMQAIGDFAISVCYKIQYAPSKKWVRSRKYDTVVASKHGSPSLFVSKPFVHADKKIMFFRHGEIKNPGIYNRIYRHTDLIVTISNGMVNMLKKRYPFAADKVILIPNIIAADAVLQRRNEYPVTRPDSPHIFCTCARLSLEKGCDLALRTAKLLRERGLDFIWIFIGGGIEKDSVTALAKDLGLEDNTLFTGQLANPFPYMSICDIYVQPSYVEAFGNTIAESLILNVPAVCTPTFGAEFLLENGRNGVMSEDFEAPSLADAIMKLTENKTLYDEIRKNLAENDHDKKSKEAAKMLNSILGGKD